jgi:hypothetical protein
MHAHWLFVRTVDRAKVRTRRYHRPGINAARVFRKIEKVSAAALFPKEAQAAGHRKGRHHCDNGISSVGFDRFKEVFDGSSHFSVSHIALERPLDRLGTGNNAGTCPVFPIVSRRESLGFEVWGTNIA